eukprot:12627190-Alexandrium_andersonii.AAC.1
MSVLQCARAGIAAHPGQSRPHSRAFPPRGTASPASLAKLACLACLASPAWPSPASPSSSQ